MNKRPAPGEAGRRQSGGGTRGTRTCWVWVGAQLSKNSAGLRDCPKPAQTGRGLMSGLIRVCRFPAFFVKATTRSDKKHRGHRGTQISNRGSEMLCGKERRAPGFRAWVNLPGPIPSFFLYSLLLGFFFKCYSSTGKRYNAHVPFTPCRLALFRSTAFTGQIFVGRDSSTVRLSKH